METATKIERARAIVALDIYRKAALDKFQATIELPELNHLFNTQGNGELKLLIEKLKTDLISLETKLEELL